jgi:hypothetical protein
MIINMKSHSCKKDYGNYDEESILYRGFTQIYDEFCPKILFFNCIFIEDNVNYGIKERTTNLSE